MRTSILAVVTVLWAQAMGLAAPPAPAVKKLVLEDKFYAEGAYYADFNKDGKLDVVAGPFWYEGPDFKKKHEIRPPKSFDPKGYSDNFLTFTGDFNGFLGYATWYPAKPDQPWVFHPVSEKRGYGQYQHGIGFGDLNGDKVPDVIVANKKGNFIHLSRPAK